MFLKNSLMAYKNQLNSYLENDYNLAIEKLTSHMKNKQYYLHDRRITYSDTKIEVDYATKNLNQSFFNNCKFVNCNFKCASFINSKFLNCKFINCNLTSTNFRNSIIEKCIFYKDDNFINTRFGDCRISDSEFDGCYFNSIILDEAIFNNCRFTNNFWNAVSTYLCEFEDKIFDSVVFRNMNFEYSIFNGIHMNNMKLPFPTIPYIYGGLKYLATTNDNVRITSQHDVKIGISKSEYLLQLDNLEIFYTYTCNYFPLANIYLAKQKLNQCKAAIIYGIKSSILKSDFRMIEMFARLISFNSVFTMHERYDLFNNTISNIANSKSVKKDNEINKCIFNLRTYLFNTGNDSSLHLSIKTNINSEEKLSKLINVIENAILTDKKCNYNIEIRHNSPYELFLNLFSDYETICYTLGILILSLKGVDKILKVALGHIKTIQEIKKQSLENKILEQKIAKTQKELNENEYPNNNEKLNKSCQKTFNELNEKNIQIQNISYFIISNNEISIIPPSDIC